MNFRALTFLILSGLILVSCYKKKPEVCPPQPGVTGESILVLNEGLFQQNNASVTRVDLNSGNTYQNYFQSIAGRPLGDTGNDIKKYGGKIYIVVNASSTIEVINAYNLQPIDQIEMQIGGIAKQPRYIDFYGANAFVTCFDGYVDVIDTTSLTVIQRIQVGNNPDQLRIAGDNIYVSNSGGLNFPNYDSTVSVISTTTMTEIKKITVGINPGSVAVGGNGDVYVVSRGDFGSVPSRMNRIETATDTKTESYNFDVNSLSEMNGNLLIFGTEGTPSLNLFDVNTNSITNTGQYNLDMVMTPYSVHYETYMDRIYVMDANGYVNSGSVFEYSSAGIFLRELNMGLVPKGIVFP